MTLIRVNPESVRSYGTQAQSLFESMTTSLDRLVNDVVAVRYFGPNAVAFKTECGRMAADFGVRPDASLEGNHRVGLEQGRILELRCAGLPGVHPRTRGPDRDRLARYGLMIADVQNVVASALGAEPITTTVEGRERYTVAIRYPRDLRSDPQSIAKDVLVSLQPKPEE